MAGWVFTTAQTTVDRWAHATCCARTHHKRGTGHGRHQKAAVGSATAMLYTDVWWHRPWVKVTEAVLWHVVAVIVGFVMMVVGLGLGVTMVMLPVGIVIGLLGVAVFVGGLFAHISQIARPHTRAF